MEETGESVYFIAETPEDASETEDSYGEGNVCASPAPYVEDGTGGGNATLLAHFMSLK